MCYAYKTPLSWLSVALVTPNNGPRHSLRGAVEKNVIKVITFKEYFPCFELHKNGVSKFESPTNEMKLRF